MILSEKFKLKRKEKGFSQKALAKGICEQSQISKIERGNYMPAADLLYKLSKKLGVTLDYFFETSIKTPSQITQFKNLATKLLNDSNYGDLDYLLKLEKEKNLFLSTEDDCYLSWIEAIIQFYHYDNAEQALKILEDALSSISNDSTIRLKILNTLANFYISLKRDTDYEAKYEEMIHLYMERDLNHQEDLLGYINVRYNHAYYLFGLNKRMEAAKEALETIAFCKNKETTHQLGALLVILANASNGILDPQQVKNYYLEARDLFRIYDNPLMLMKIEHYLKEIDTKEG